VRQPPGRADTVKLLENILGIQEAPEEDLSQFLHQGMKGSCQWFHNRRSFQDWTSNANEANKIFWLGGLPGTGKSTLAGMTIDYLQKTLLPQSCQYHFFIQAQHTKKKVTYCLRSIAFQLACANDVFAGKIIRLHEDTGITFGASKINTIWEKVYEGIVFKMEFDYTLHWVLDGLDEADASIILVKNLMQMQSRTCIKVLLLSRPTKDLSNLATCRGDLVTYEVISVTDTIDDIRSYAQAVVHEALPNDGKVQENIIDQVLEKAEGSFLWTKLALNTLRDNWHTQDDIQRALNDVPNDMRSLYKRMVQLIDSQAPRLRQMAVRILTWATCSFRPLKISELEIALSPEFEGFVSLGDTIIQICGHFIRMDNNTISLIHATARQFLLDSFDDQPPVVGFHDGHERLATVCIRHLSEDRWRRVLTQTLDGAAIKGKGDRLASIYGKHPFLKYAKENWAFHVSHSTHDSEGLLLFLQTFFDKYVLSWIHAVAASNSLRTVTHSAQYLKVFLRRRKRNQSLETPTSLIAADYESRENKVRFLGLWITDLIRMVGKFGSNLIQNPSTIYRHIPPLCPRNSIIAQTYDREYDSLLSVKGISSGGWDDNLARLTVSQDEMVSKVLCTGAYFITLISSNGTMVIWYAETCEEVRRIHHQEYTTLMCINKSGNLIASAGRFTFRIWDISTGEQLYCMAKDTQARTMSLNFGSSDSELLVGFDDCYVVTYDLTTPGKIRRFAAEEAGGDDHSCPRLMVASPDLTQLAIAYRGRPVLLWDMTSASTQQPQRCIRTEDQDRWDKEDKEVWNAPEVVRWHPDGRSLFILYQDTTLVDWRPIEDEQFEYGHIEAREMVVDQDGTFLLTSNNNGTLSVWTIPRFNLVYRLCYEEFVRDLAFSPDGQRIYDTRGSLCNVWEPDALIRLEEFDRDESSSSCDSFVSEPVYAQDDNERSQITSLTCEHNDEFFCCGRDNGTVSLHEMSDGKKIRKLYSHASTVAVIALAWSPSGRFLVSGDDSGKVTAKRLRIKDGGKWAVYPVLEIRIDETVEQFLFSPDEEKLLISTAFVDRIWSLKEKREICKKRWGSKSGRKWINHPLDEAHILWVDPDELHVYDWRTLRRAATQKTSIIEDRREEDDQQAISPMEGLPSFTLNKPVDVQETVHTVAQTSNRRYVICETLPDTGHTRSSSTKDLRLDLLVTSDLKLHKENLVRRKDLIQLAQNAQRLLGCYRDRIVFLDQQNWLCTWDVDWPTEDFKRHFFLPRDWLNTSALQLVSLSKQGTLLCPRNGEVAIVRYTKTM
jgi:WD40 repeat protein